VEVTEISGGGGIVGGNENKSYHNLIEVAYSYLPSFGSPPYSHFHVFFFLFFYLYLFTILFSSFQLLSEPEHLVIRALGGVVDPACSEQLAKDLVGVFETTGKALKLIQSMITYEVATTSSAGTLFRGNSLASHLMVSYARSVEKTYLATTLKPLIEIVKSSGKSYEIDPAKIKSGESVTENISGLSTLTSAFLDRIVSSLSTCPPYVLIFIFPSFFKP
jgi:hypothetical protein